MNLRLKKGKDELLISSLCFSDLNKRLHSASSLKNLGVIFNFFQFLQLKAKLIPLKHIPDLSISFSFYR